MIVLWLLLSSLEYVATATWGGRYYTVIFLQVLYVHSAGNKFLWLFKSFLVFVYLIFMLYWRFWTSPVLVSAPESAP